MPKKNIEIFKVQTAFDMSNHLIYNEDRSIEDIIPYDEALFKLCDFKGYVEAYVGANKTICIVRKLKAKEWPKW